MNLVHLLNEHSARVILTITENEPQDLKQGESLGWLDIFLPVLELQELSALQLRPGLCVLLVNSLKNLISNRKRCDSVHHSSKVLMVERQSIYIVLMARY